LSKIFDATFNIKALALPNQLDQMSLDLLGMEHYMELGKNKPTKYPMLLGSSS
jgi:hypothetical protein